MRRILATGLTLLALASCGKSDKAEKYEVDRARKVLNVGHPNVITVHMSQSGMGMGPETRFYDLDGDKKTVEQYVILYNNGSGIPRPIGIRLDLLRPGAEPEFDPENRHGVREEMAPKEAKRIDALYQDLLRDYVK